MLITMTMCADEQLATMKHGGRAPTRGTIHDLKLRAFLHSSSPTTHTAYYALCYPLGGHCCERFSNSQEIKTIIQVAVKLA